MQEVTGSTPVFSTDHRKPLKFRGLRVFGRKFLTSHFASGFCPYSPRVSETLQMRDKKIFAHPTRPKLVYRLTHRGDDMNCRWRISWKFDGGKRRERYGDINQGLTYAERYARAMRVLQELYEEHRTHLPPCEIRFQAASFIEKMSASWRPKTTMAHRQVFDEYFQLLNGKRPTAKVTKQYLDGMRQKYSGITFNKRLQLLGRILKAVGYGYVLAGAERVRAHSEPYRIYQRNHRLQLKKCLERQDPELWLFCQFQFYCFIRPGELRQLRVGDILWDSMEIRIPGHVAKNRRMQNAVIPDAFASIVEEKYLMADPDSYLFPSPRNPRYPIGANTMSERHRQLLKELRYPTGFVLYSWKHTGAVMAIRAGVGVKELMLLMRHSSLQETDRYLARLGIKDIPNFRHRMPAIDATSPGSRR